MDFRWKRPHGVRVWLLAITIAGVFGSCNGDGEETSSTDANTDQCEDITEPVAGESTPVTVTFRNDSASTIYVPSLSECYLKAYNLSADALPAGYQLGGGGCGSACSSVLSEDCNLCEGDGACSETRTTIVLPPGASYEADGWGGGVSEVRDIPAECVKFDHCADSCTVAAPAPAGDYTFTVVGRSECTGDGCDCPNPGEVCTLELDSVFAGDPIEVSVTIAYPTTAGADLVFN
ncbi:MAG: hypothetical protein R3A51_20345 [Nannocystaceae bacterium]|nr:hypothetical protein [Myxococcales bacterium]